LKIAYYDQHQNALDDDKTVMQTLWALVPQEPQGYVLAWLARFAFTGDSVEKKVSVLSGGEKSRLYLSVLIHQKPNLLVLDEPTNHLDIPMRDALLEALNTFEGTIVFVSHDRHFISSLADKYWVFCKKSASPKTFTTIVDYIGSAEDAIEMSFAEPEIPKAVAAPRERKKKINPWHLEQLNKEIEDKQMHLQSMQAQREQIHGLLAESATYNDSAKVRRLTDEDKNLEHSILILNGESADLEDRYLVMACDD